MNSSRRVVRVRVAAAVAGLALALAGCSYTNPPDVLTVTDPGDGRSAVIGGDDGNGGVKLRNFLVVSDGSGQARAPSSGPSRTRRGEPAQVS